MNLKDVHLIGHSLGAQLCGFAGKGLNKVGRITGLDPAGPSFDGVSKQARLDRSDAGFVDVIHTDAKPFVPFFGLGILQAVGHVDFYPNGGKDQPNCDKKIFGGSIRGLLCNHMRALDYFTASINAKNVPLAHKCTNYHDFLNGLCSDCGVNGEKCAIMGYRAHQWLTFQNNQIENKMFLKTTGNYPYFL